MEQVSGSIFCINGFIVLCTKNSSSNTPTKCERGTRFHFRYGHSLSMMNYFAVARQRQAMDWEIFCEVYGIFSPFWHKNGSQKHFHRKILFLTWPWLSEEPKTSVKNPKTKQTNPTRTTEVDQTVSSFRGSAKLTIESCPSLINYI